MNLNADRAAFLFTAKVMNGPHDFDNSLSAPEIGKLLRLSNQLDGSFRYELRHKHLGFILQLERAPGEAEAAMVILIFRANGKELRAAISVLEEARLTSLAGEKRVLARFRDVEETRGIIEWIRAKTKKKASSLCGFTDGVFRPSLSTRQLPVALATRRVVNA